SSPQEESNSSPSDQEIPRYCTVTLESSCTSGPSPCFSTSTTRSSEGSPSGVSIIGAWVSSSRLTCGNLLSSSVVSTGSPVAWLGIELSRGLHAHSAGQSAPSDSGGVQTGL